jgi:integrase
MASIHKQRGRAYWFAAYCDALGRQHFVSTKIRHTPPGHDAKERASNASANRRLAQETAIRLEEAERGNATEAHLRKVLADISERVNRRRLEFKKAETFLNDWVDRTQKTKSLGTYERYGGIVRSFLSSLGAKAQAALSDITVQDIQQFIEQRLDGGRNPSTVRTDAKILSVPFAMAVRQGVILVNPVSAAEIPEGPKESRTPFTASHLEALLEATEALAAQEPENAIIWNEWKTCILVGFFTGIRLGDAVGLSLAHFDFEQHVLKLRPQKTSRKKRDLVIPLHPQLEAHILDLPKGDEEGHLCPKLARRKVSGKYGLSLQFHEIVGKAAIEQETVAAHGAAGHRFHKYTYHSLRHSFVTALANAGVAPDVRQLLAGHSTQRSHAVYTHTQLDTLKAAIRQLPKIA